MVSQEQVRHLVEDDVILVPGARPTLVEDDVLVGNRQTGAGQSSRFPIRRNWQQVDRPASAYRQCLAECMHIKGHWQLDLTEPLLTPATQRSEIHGCVPYIVGVPLTDRVTRAVAMWLPLVPS